ncbi:MAG: hypothetical protein N2443_10850 [Blastocatellia bacterium]|nr:hypothetical protein [Blastocatellia bacterium]
MSKAPSLVELWLGVEESLLWDAAVRWRYRPALLFECLLEFRDPRAELVHSEDRRYTTWLPHDEAAADWSVPAVDDLALEQVRTAPQPEVQPYEGAVTLTEARLEEIENDLIAHLVRSERLMLYHNPNLRLYSRWNESREEFLERVVEEARERLHPALKELMREFQIQLEQLRQRPLPMDVPDELRIGLDVLRRRMISRVEAQLHRTVLDHPLGTALHSVEIEEEFGKASAAAEVPEELQSLAQELERLYEAAAARAQALLRGALEHARECEPYAVALHPNGIRVMRRALLWVPVPE